MSRSAVTTSGSKQPVPKDVADTGEDALRLVPSRERRPLRHEQREQYERDEECGGVDVEDLGGADERDQETGRHRPKQRRRPLGALDDGVRLRDDALVLANELRQDESLRGVVRGEEDAEQRDEDQEQPKREDAE